MKFIKKCFAVLFKPWLLALIAIILLALIIWYIGPIIAIGDYKPLVSELVRLISIFVIFIIWGLSNLRRKSSAKKSGGKMADELIQDIEKSKPADDNPDSKVLSNRLTDALKLLQNSDVKGYNKLYSLPWYMIIGAPGSGKTTALKSSGLNFPLHSKMGDEPIHGEGGTRYCDWWFTDEAILIDTAGRYTTQDNPKKIESKSWLSFLGLLKKTRPKRPLNGIIVTISINDILHKTATQKALQTKAIKQRIQEVNNHLSMDLPVYVIFTKVDTIAGFNSFFSDLDKEEREQAWGFTFANLKADKQHYEESFDKEFTILMERINSRIVNRLNQESNTQKRALTYEFPRQMFALKSMLQEFVAGIFSRNQFETPFLLRGVYFISSTQANMASQWVTSLLPGQEISPPIDITTTKEPKTFFVNQLFKNVIFQEANIAGLNARARMSKLWLFYGMLGVSLVSFLAIVGGWYYSKSLNVQYIETVRESVQSYKDETNGGLQKPHDWLILAKGLNVLKIMPTGFDKGIDRPFEQGLGLYQGDKLGVRARDSYIYALSAFFMKDLNKMLVEQVEDAHRDDELLYEALRYYLMLYTPEQMDKEGFSIWVNALWEQQLPAQGRDVLLSHLNEHLAVALDDSGVIAPPMDEKTVERAREVLVTTPIEYRIYRRLKTDYLHKHKKQLTVKKILGGRSGAIFTRKSGASLADGVPQFFTYKGFHTGFLIQSKTLAKRLVDEQWIYGDIEANKLSKDDIEKIGKKVDEYYFNEYIFHWEEFITDLEIKSFNTVNEGQAVVRLIASSGQPLVTLLKALRKQTALSDPPVVSGAALELTDKLTDEVARNKKDRVERLMPKSTNASAVRLAGGEVTDHFIEFNDYINEDDGMPLSALQKAFGELNDHFKAISYDSNQNKSAFDVASSQNSRNKPENRVKQAVAEAPVIIQNWFTGVTKNSSKVVTDNTIKHINNVWQAEVQPFFNKALKGRYPIRKDSQRDIKIEDFSAFFGPSGVLDKFYKQQIEQFVDTSITPWRWTNKAFGSKEALAFFEKSQRIKKAYFDSSGDLSVKFALKPNTLDSAAINVLLDLEGETLMYDHGPIRSSKVVWPNRDVDTAKLTLNLGSKGTPVSVNTSGEWSWFRLIDKYATRKPLANSDSLLLTFVVKNLKVQYVLTPKTTFNPFNNWDIRNFTLPKRLLYGR